MSGRPEDLTPKQIRWLNSRRTGNEYKARIVPMPVVAQGKGRNAEKARLRAAKKEAKK
jgi:hypothetical protein